MKKEEVREKFREIYPKRKDLGLTSDAKVAKYFKVHPLTARKWRLEIENGQDQVYKLQNPEKGEFDVKDFLGENKQELAKAILTAAQNPRASAPVLKLFADLIGETKERDERRIDYTPADRLRIGRETIKGLREQYKSNGGRCHVCGFDAVLCEEVGEVTEPEHGEDREVEAVGLSE
jgi:hypothetical protein